MHAGHDEDYFHSYAASITATEATIAMLKSDLIVCKTSSHY
jgi:hypothetical protein